MYVFIQYRIQERAKACIRISSTLAETYPMHVVCAWIGNSAAIAQEHYPQATDEHFAEAVRDLHEKAAQNQAQSTAEWVGKGEETPQAKNKNRPDLPSDSEQSRRFHPTQIPPRGVEPLSSG